MKTETEDLVAYSVNLGNLHDVAAFANSMGWARWLVTASGSGGHSVALFVLPRPTLNAYKQKADDLRRETIGRMEMGG